jgi:EmrB/QacA subfamily drug resistance transporter
VITETPFYSRPLTWLVAGAFFMENLDSTVVVTALPEMAKSFGVQPVDVNVGIMAYVLTLAVLIPASGWAADRYGSRAIFASAIAIFTFGSALCGLSPNLTAFTLAEIFQGIGGAMMVPVGRLVVLRSANKHELIRAIATITWPGLAAPVLGPPLGGFITYYFSWHWIFLLNIPLGLIALPLALKLLPNDRNPIRNRLDVIGFALVALTSVCAMYVVEHLGHGNPSWISTLAPIAATLILALAAVIHARRHPRPMLDFWAMQFRSFSVTILGGSLFRIATGAIPFVLPLMFQLGFGLNSAQSGTLVLSVFAGNLAMKSCTTAILRRIAFKKLIILNGCLNSLAILLCALLTPATPTVLIGCLLFLSGMTRSMQFTAMSTLAFADVPKERMNGASSLFSIVQQATLGMGIALAASLIRFGSFLGGDAPGDTSLRAFHIALICMSAISLLSLIGALRLDSNAGDQIRIRKLAA